MKLQCYALRKDPPELKPARPSRQWMDEFPSRHAYRCLPLSIANTYGWEILCPGSFEIRWNGGPEAKDITFHPLGNNPWLNHFVNSNFTHGIVTFHTGYLFRTEPGWHTFAGGPLNQPKDGIAPLTGVIETDWLPYPFTMNWQLTRPGVVRWQKDEPFCVVFPVKQGVLDETKVVIRNLEDNLPLKLEYDAWRARREEFMGKFRAGDPETLKQAWQKYYYHGKLASTGGAVPGHAIKLHVKPPVDKR